MWLYSSYVEQNWVSPNRSKQFKGDSDFIMYLCSYENQRLLFGRKMRSIRVNNLSIECVLPVLSEPWAVDFQTHSKIKNKITALEKKICATKSPLESLTPAILNVGVAGLPVHPHNEWTWGFTKLHIVILLPAVRGMGQSPGFLFLTCFLFL